jgi:hypothetical protein
MLCRCVRTACSWLDIVGHGLQRRALYVRLCRTLLGSILQLQQLHVHLDFEALH